MSIVFGSSRPWTLRRACEVWSASCEDRLLSYRKLEAEAAYERRKVDPRARAEQVAEHKTAMKTLKYHPKHQRQD